MERLPGPSDYKVGDLGKSHYYKFPKEKRLVDKFEVLPGPADYHIPCSIRDVPKYEMKKGNFLKEYSYI